jgi:hypothetical protein
MIVLWSMRAHDIACHATRQGELISVAADCVQTPLPLGAYSALDCAKRNSQIGFMPKLPPNRVVLDRKLERQQDQGARLHRVRCALGISQKSAAETVGVPYLKWHKMEHGTHPLDPLALQIFCEKYGLGADYVILAMYTALPPVLRERVLEMEQEELQQALQEAVAGKPPERTAPDIKRRVLHRLAVTPAPLATEDPTTKRKQKTLAALVAVPA